MAEQESGAVAPGASGADEALALAEAAGDGQQQAEGEVGGGVEEHARGVRRDDATGGAGRQVDVVVAGGDVGDDLEPRPGGLEELGVDPVGQDGAHRVGALDEGEQLGAVRGLRAVVDDDLVPARAQPGDAGLGDRIGDADPCHEGLPQVNGRCQTMLTTGAPAPTVRVG